MSPAKQPTTPITVTHAASDERGPDEPAQALDARRGSEAVVPTTGSTGAGFTRNRTKLAAAPPIVIHSTGATAATVGGRSGRATGRA